MIAALLVSVALAGDPLIRPVVPEPVAGECARSVPLRAGEPVPAALLGSDGLVKCSAVAEPVSRVAYLLAVERHRDGLEALHSLDLRLLEAERDWYRDAYVKAGAPEAWYLRPSVQRWGGRFEALACVAVVGAVLAGVYNGGGR